ncbi:hypothetical protein AMTRI_Chr03g48110 [Amborella trichopoda]
MAFFFIIPLFLFLFQFGLGPRILSPDRYNYFCFFLAFYGKFIKLLIYLAFHWMSYLVNFKTHNVCHLLDYLN